MYISTVTSRDFARDVDRAKRVAEEGPVFITERRKPAYVLLKIEDYFQLSGGHRETSLLEFMHGSDTPRTDGIEFDTGKISFDVPAVGIA
jgi:hypothetical protein